MVGACAPVVDQDLLGRARDFLRSLVEVDLHSHKAVVLLTEKGLNQAVISETVWFKKKVDKLQITLYDYMIQQSSAGTYEKPPPNNAARYELVQNEWHDEYGARKAQPPTTQQQYKTKTKIRMPLTLGRGCRACTRRGRWAIPDAVGS